MFVEAVTYIQQNKLILVPGHHCRLGCDLQETDRTGQHAAALYITELLPKI